ncbi:MAG: hypothetical protein ABSG83_04050 [Roseiarcus sp.]|jgi:hypothetical protein
MGTTADKIARAILAHERAGVIDLSSYRAAQAAAGDARLGDDRLRELLASGYDPAHAVYLYAQNFASLLSEEMSGMKELRHFVVVVGEAEEAYLPSFPPNSPVTTSHFTMWAFFDVQFGQSHETIGTCILRLARDMPLPGWLVDALAAMQKSRMGFYVHEGFEDRFVRFREIGGEGVSLCHPTSGFKGAEGEIWFGRMLPPMNHLVKYHIFFTTPYVMVQTTEAAIAAYLERETGRAAGRRLPRGLDAREFVLKHGPSPNHWNEYVFCAYSNYRNDAVFIAGVPDDRKSLPLGDLMRATS